MIVYSVAQEFFMCTDGCGHWCGSGRAACAVWQGVEKTF